MADLSMLDVAIGLIFVYLLLSLICSAINEGIAAALTSRGGHLADGIEQLLGDPAMRDNLYNHSLIQALCQKSSKPSYIPARTFAIAVLDLIAPPKSDGTSHDLASVRTKLNASTTTLGKAVAALADKGSTDLPELRQNIENWYNDSMDRLSGWYKRRTQWVLLVLSLIAAVSLNVDSVVVTRSLLSQPALRTSVAGAAQQFVSHNAANPTTFPSATLDEVTKGLNALNLPIGWGGTNWGAAGPYWIFEKIAGLLITTIAVSMGAPFWFDTLNKIMQFRSAVKPPAKPKP